MWGSSSSDTLVALCHWGHPLYTHTYIYIYIYSFDSTLPIASTMPTSGGRGANSSQGYVTEEWQTTLNPTDTVRLGENGSCLGRHFHPCLLVSTRSYHHLVNLTVKDSWDRSERKGTNLRLQTIQTKKRIVQRETQSKHWQINSKSFRPPLPKRSIKLFPRRKSMPTTQ